jgi:hypothetical protein
MGQIDVSVRDGRSGETWPDAAGGFGNPQGTPDGRQSPDRGRATGAEEARVEDRLPRRGQYLVDYLA